MKIDTRRIQADGAEFFEQIDARALELGTEIIEFCSPLCLRVRASMITNALTVEARVQGQLKTVCGRCLRECAVDLVKEFTINYCVDPRRPVVDLDPDVREEIILDYPISPLCSDGCKGLCPRCGTNLNEGGCSCGTT